MPAQESTLWVSYTDPATLRRRLVGVAQQVRAELEKGGMAPLPQLVLPAHNRVRHGFWFMKFEQKELMEEARAALHDRPFRTACGSMEGVLQLDVGSKPLNLRTILRLDETPTDRVRSWLGAKFSKHGAVDEVMIPRLACNWDGGIAYVRFESGEEAERALLALDGTPSCVAGCNMFIDYAQARPLVQFVGVPPVSDATGAAAVAA